MKKVVTAIAGLLIACLVLMACGPDVNTSVNKSDASFKGNVKSQPKMGTGGGTGSAGAGAQD